MVVNREASVRKVCNRVANRNIFNQDRQAHKVLYSHLPLKSILVLSALFALHSFSLPVAAKPDVSAAATKNLVQHVRDALEWRPSSDALAETAARFRQPGNQLLTDARADQPRALRSDDNLYPAFCQSTLQQWQPAPADSDMMVITAHPDDEGIFFGGALPYYTQVRNKSVILIGMTGPIYEGGLDRLEELERAAWHYGVRHQPVNLRYPDLSSNVLATWGNGRGIEAVVERLATEYRRYRPRVVVSHDLNGEYGHEAHRVTAEAVRRAVYMANDPAINLEGLQPWEVSKLYLHLYQSPRGDALVPDRTVTPEGYLYHSWDESSVALGGKTPRQIANEGLQCQLSPVQVWPDIQASTRAVQGEVFDGYHSEDWGLIWSTVGADRIPGDFFQNLEPAVPVTEDAALNSAVSAAHSGLCLASEGGSLARDTRIIQAACDSEAVDQRFMLREFGAGLVELYNLGNNWCLHVENYSSQTGARFVQTGCNRDSLNSVFRPIPANGGWRLQIQHSNQCVGIAGASSSPGAALIQEPCGAGSGQIFREVNITEPANPGGLPPLVIDRMDSAKYGFRYDGINDQREALERIFDASGTDVLFTVSGFDIDTSSEVRVLVNGAELGFLSRSPNNGTRTTQLVIPQSLLSNTGNTLRFEQSNPGWIWGVTDLLLSESGGTNELLPLILDSVDSARYGFRYDGINSHREFLQRQFEASGTDLLLTVSGFDIDTNSEVRVLVNGTEVGFLSRSPNNGTRMSQLVIPRSLLNGTNILRFEQSNPGWIWGVTDLLLNASGR